MFDQMINMREVFLTFGPGLKLMPNIFTPGVREPTGDNTNCGIEILASITITEFPSNSGLY